MELRNESATGFPSRLPALFLDLAGRVRAAFRAPSATPGARRRRADRRAALAMALLTVAAASVFYRSAWHEARQSAAAALAATAEGSAARLDAWLAGARQRLALGSAAPPLLRALQHWQGNGRRDSDALLEQFRILASDGGFVEISLYGPDGVLQLATEASRVPTALGIDDVPQGVRFDDVHPGEGGRAPAIGLVTPLRSGPEGRIRGWLYAMLDETRLESLMLPPTAPTTGEILLLRSDGNPVLSPEPSSNRLAPLGFPGPLPGKTGRIASRIAAGARGFVEGLDDRLAASYAHAEPLPGTPWLVVARMDASQALAGANRLSLLAALMFGALLAAGLRLLRQRPENLPDERALRLGQRYETADALIDEGLLVLDAQRRVVDANEAACRIYGRPRDKLLGMEALALRSPADDGDALPLPDTGCAEPLVHEEMHRRQDGTLFPVEIVDMARAGDDGPRFWRIVRDIGARKAAEAHIERLSRLSVTLSAVNHAIGREKHLEDVFRITCDACVEHGGFDFSLLFRVDRGRLRVAHAAGQAGATLVGQVVDPDDPAGRFCSARSAFRLRRLCICDDADDAGDCLDCAPGPGHGPAASMPIEHEGAIVGVLTVYGGAVSTFDAHSKLLLGELAESLSFAIQRFAEQAARRETQEALRRREAQLLRAEELARLGHWEYDLETGRRVWSPQICRLFGLDPEAPPPDDIDAFIDRYFTPESARITREGIRQAIVTGQRVQLEQQQVVLDGLRTATHTTMIVPIRNSAGWTVALHGTVQDITEHKLNEARLAKMASRLAQAAREYEDLYQNAPCGYHSLDKDGIFQRINETELNWLGYQRHEVIGRMRYVDLLDAPSRANFYENFPRFQETGEVHDLEHNLICRDGSILPVLINATAIRDETGRFLMSRSTAYNMSERRKIEHEREVYARRLTHLSRHLVNMQEEERRRLSASLHDRTSPNLAAISLNLSTIAIAGSGTLPPELAEHLEDIRALVDDTTASIREISAELRPPLLDYAGLVPALEGYLYQYSKRTGTETRFDADLAERPPFEVESLLFRITQEALTNCAKHAGASLVEVGLKRAGERILLEIRDNGTGFDPDSLGRDGSSPGLGMLNMREMTEFAGGRFSVDARPGHGTTIHVEI